MEFLFGGSSFNIILIFAVLAFALIAIFTDSTPVKWISSLLAIAGLGLLYKRLFPSDSEIKRKFEENQAAANQYFEDRKENLHTIGQNNKRIEQLEKEKALLNDQDNEAKQQIRILDTEISQLETQTKNLEASVEERQKRLNNFFSRKDTATVAASSTANPASGASAMPVQNPVSTPTPSPSPSPSPAVSAFSIAVYHLKGDVE